MLTTAAGDYLLLPDGRTQIALQMESSVLVGITTLQLPDGQTNLLLADNMTYISINKVYSSL